MTLRRTTRKRKTRWGKTMSDNEDEEEGERGWVSILCTSIFLHPVDWYFFFLQSFSLQKNSSKNCRTWWRCLLPHGVSPSYKLSKFPWTVSPSLHISTLNTVQFLKAELCSLGLADTHLSGRRHHFSPDRVDGDPIGQRVAAWAGSLVMNNIRITFHHSPTAMHCCKQDIFRVCAVYFHH